MTQPFVKVVKRINREYECVYDAGLETGLCKPGTFFRPSSKMPSDNMTKQNKNVTQLSYGELGASLRVRQCEKSIDAESSSFFVTEEKEKENGIKEKNILPMISPDIGHVSNVPKYNMDCKFMKNWGYCLSNSCRWNHDFHAEYTTKVDNLWHLAGAHSADPAAAQQKTLFKIASKFGRVTQPISLQVESTCMALVLFDNEPSAKRFVQHMCTHHYPIKASMDGAVFYHKTRIPAMQTNIETIRNGKTANFSLGVQSVKNCDAELEFDKNEDSEGDSDDEVMLEENAGLEEDSDDEIMIENNGDFEEESNDDLTLESNENFEENGQFNFETNEETN